MKRDERTTRVLGMSIPVELIERMDVAARAAGRSRSRFVAEVVAAFLDGTVRRKTGRKIAGKK